MRSEEANRTKSYKFKLLEDKKKYSIDKIYDKNNKKIVIKYDFKINSISNDDFGVYSCEVSNSKGLSEFIFEIQSKGRLNTK